jgi:hypothetical protein
MTVTEMEKDFSSGGRKIVRKREFEKERRLLA